MRKILIVEDELKLREELKIFLSNNGYYVETVNSFSDTLNSVKNIATDIILMDINLPNSNGEYLCKELRKEIDTPIIMVTSRNNEIDELMSINNGADDFITKPYNPQILLARIEAILKRTNKKDPIIVEYKNIKLDVSKSLIVCENRNIELSKNELKIFYFLLQSKGVIKSRDEIMNYLWGLGEYVDDNTLTVNINRLRNKLEEADLKDSIETRRGQGYIIL